MTYHLRNITSVKMTQGASDENGGGCLTLIGIGFLLMTCFYKFSSKALIVSLGVTVLGIIWLSKAKGIYNVTLTSASVETHALSSKDINYIEKVVGNINEAIVHSG